MASRSNRSRNRLEIPGAISLMDKLKLEIAEELGIHNYDKLDKGDLPARIHGKIGGLMVRRLIEYAEQQILENPQSFQEVTSANVANENDKNDVQEYLQKYAGISQTIEQAGQQEIH